MPERCPARPGLACELDTRRIYGTSRGVCGGSLGTAYLAGRGGLCGRGAAHRQTGPPHPRRSDSSQAREVRPFPCGLEPGRRSRRLLVNPRGSGTASPLPAVGRHHVTPAARCRPLGRARDGHAPWAEARGEGPPRFPLRDVCGPGRRTSVPLKDWKEDASEGRASGDGASERARPRVSRLSGACAWNDCGRPCLSPPSPFARPTR